LDRTGKNTDVWEHSVTMVVFSQEVVVCRVNCDTYLFHQQNPQKNVDGTLYCDLYVFPGGDFPVPKTTPLDTSAVKDRPKTKNRPPSSRSNVSEIARLMWEGMCQCSLF